MLIQAAGPEPQNYSQQVSKEGVTPEAQPLRDILLKKIFFNSERNLPNEIQSIKKRVHFSSVQSLSRVRLLATP